ncbi:MAG: NADH-quinone oxidoreductase subunit C [Pirellulales bacterium]|jgi:NADH-quinone oxidoreductase subunit C
MSAEPDTSTDSPLADGSDVGYQALAAAMPGLETSVFRGQRRVVVPPSSLADAMKRLKDNGFDLLVDVTCVDYLEYRGATSRYGLVYLLVNTRTNERLTVRSFVDDPEPTVPSMVPLWPAANWLEREVWDMYGIRFSGHPDLRRLMMPEEFTAHPLRKDYPLQGKGERHNFPVISREQS